MDESNDWKKFFQDDSDGVTKTGQLFLQKAAEAYVYCVLGAQAQTRWRIVGDGAKSLQTQKVFAKLVKDSVAQDDDKVLITNMRTAVKATNVVLNLAILPKLILIPSDLLFLKKKIPGYNNTLTLATKKMKFGENKGLNFEAPSEGTEGTDASEPEEVSDREDASEPKDPEEASDSEEASDREEASEVTEGHAGRLLTSAGSQIYRVYEANKANKANKELGVVFAVLTLAGAFGAWLW